MEKRRESMEDGDALLLKNNVNYERERERQRMGKRRKRHCYARG